MYSNYSKFLTGTNKYIELHNQKEEFKNSRQILRIKSGSKNFDDILNGGFYSGKIYLIFGANHTGKTQICHQLCVKAYKKNIKSVYIDTENTFRPERILEIGNTLKSDSHKLLKSIFVSKIMSNSMLLLNLKEVENLIKRRNIRMILIDSINNHYRVEQAKKSINFSKIKSTFLKILKKVNDLTNKYDLITIATAQVTPNFVKNSILNENPVGVQYLNHYFSEFIYLNYQEDSIAHAHMVNSLNLSEKKALYKITSKGIKDYVSL